MELIKDHGKFTESKTLFLGTVKQVWEQATVLGLSAIHHYVDTKDASWIAELQNCFLDAGGNFSQCFEKAVYATTNVKFRQDETNLEAAVTCKTKGNMPDGFGDILSTIEREGLRRYESKTKSKGRAAAWNNDGVRKPREQKSSAADITSLKQTELGKTLIASAEAGAKLEGDQAKKAQELVDNLNKQMEALANGEELPSEEVKSPEAEGLLGIKSDPLFFDDAELDLAIQETLDVLKELAMVDPSIKNRRNQDARATLLKMLAMTRQQASDSIQAFKKITEAAKNAA